jgi:hypothetical protein
MYVFLEQAVKVKHSMRIIPIMISIGQRITDKHKPNVIVYNIHGHHLEVVDSTKYLLVSPSIKA